MLNIFELFDKDSFVFLDKISSKKFLFELLSDKASMVFGSNSRSIFKDLIKREKLGSTSIGKGIAIPHVVHDSISQPKCIITVISSGIDYQGVDKIPVDIVFFLFLPTSIKSKELQILASLSRLVRNLELINKLRGCKNPESAFVIFSQFLEVQAA